MNFDGAAGITAVEIVSPEERSSIEEMTAAMPAVDDRRFAASLGIDEIRIAAPASPVALAATAAQNLLRRVVLDPAQVDLLVHIPSRVPELLMTSEVTYVQEQTGTTAATCLAVGDLGCASSSAALAVALSMMQTEFDWQTALVTHASLTPTPDRLRRPVTINGDGAVAVLLTRDPVVVVEDLTMQSDGRFWDLFSVDYQGKDRSEWVEHCKSEQTYSFDLAMTSRNMIRQAVQDQLEAMGLTLDDMRHVIMQNLSTGSFMFYEQLLERRVNAVCAQNLSRYGHLGPADIFVNLASLLPQLKAGERVMVINSSPSAAWSTTVMRAV